MKPREPLVSCFKKPRLDKPDKPALRHDFDDGFYQVVELIKIRHQTSKDGHETIDKLLQKLVEQFVVAEKPDDDEGDDDATKRGREREAILLSELGKVTNQIGKFDKENIFAPELKKMGDIILNALKGIAEDEDRYDKYWRSETFKDPLCWLR
ncbi:MAG: hypothetical protein Q9223_001040 [Gallowayella weberi]